MLPRSRAIYAREHAVFKIFSRRSVTRYKPLMMEDGANSAGNVACPGEVCPERRA